MENSSALARHFTRLRGLGALFALSYLVVVVFYPTTGFGFVDYDVEQQVLSNPHVRGLTSENLRHIFTSRCINSYYPIRTLSYAVDYSVWGLNPCGFKLTNAVIHWLNVILVFWLVLRLYPRCPSPDGNSALWDTFAAAFAAAIFAIHPVVVETVAWVPGREELLMTLGALGCFHFHLAAHDSSEQGRRLLAFTWRALAIVSCGLACLSNAVAAVIPFLITAWDLLMRPRSERRQTILDTGALWLIGAATVLIKLLGRDAESNVLESGISVVERLRLAVSVYGLNLKSLFWPSELAFHYSRVKADSFLDPTFLFGVLCVGATCATLWTLRWKRMLVFGLAWFVLALGPSAQIMTHHVHRADRFLYLPLVGLAVFIAIAFRSLNAMLKNRAALIGVVALAIAVILTLDVRSTRQVQTWRDSLALWENCVKVCPDNSVAQDLLARQLIKIGDAEGAREHALRSLELDMVDNHAALCSRAMKLLASPNTGQSGREEALRLAQRACELTEGTSSKYLQVLAMAYLATGQRDSALAAAEKAAQVADQSGAPDLAGAIRQWIQDLPEDPDVFPQDPTKPGP